MRFFDFFAGIGGFRLGMEMAGHECVGHCEIDKYANASYVAMHHPKESEVFFEDVRTIKPSDMPECECFRLQGFPDEYFDRAASVNSDSQLYKQAWNSVTVNVIYEIAKRLNKEEP